jgi:hypothetical protein
MARPRRAAVQLRDGESKKRGSFRATAEIRVNKSIAALRHVAALNKPAIYEFTQQDLTKIVSALESEFGLLKEAFSRDALRKSNFAL